MSYPRKLHILVVEDDSDAIQGYRDWFATLKKRTPPFPFVDPTYARSFEDAKAKIESDDLYHVVILDMNLPAATRTQALVGLSLGEQLLEACANRDSCPIPVALIVSGKLNLAQSIHGINQRLQNDFFLGRLINKTPEQYSEIYDAMLQAQRYCDVGIHIRDGGRDWYPTLSPREEDLLRRCVLSQPSCLGLDLRWWTAENGASFSRPDPNAGPTKVLMGLFLLDDGLGASLPTFFKIEPSGNGQYVLRDAAILEHKVPHVKVISSSLKSRQRSLIATQSVTNRGWPMSLNEYLDGDPGLVQSHVANLVKATMSQLEHLGEREEDEIRCSDFFWSGLSNDAMLKAWSSCESEQFTKLSLPNPIETFNRIKQSRAKCWSARRRCTHGDLNATNIAIDASDPNRPQAYIFDAANMHSDLEYRDLATLEITTILFNSSADNDVLDAAKVFYTDGFVPDLSTLTEVGLTRNVLQLLYAIRTQIPAEAAREAYPLLLFGAALQQLSGLGFQPSPNKVRNPLHACCLASWIAKWIVALSPTLVADAATGPNTPEAVKPQ